MEITLEEVDETKTNVKVKEKPVRFIKRHEGHFLCYSNGRHTTTKNLLEVIRFFNGDYGSYYYRQKE